MKNKLFLSVILILLYQNLNAQIKSYKLSDYKLPVIKRHQLDLNFNLNGSYHLQGQNFSGSILFDDTDLTPYFKLANQTHLKGKITGKIEASGNVNLGNVRKIAETGVNYISIGSITHSVKALDISLILKQRILKIS